MFFRLMRWALLCGFECAALVARSMQHTKYFYSARETVIDDVVSSDQGAGLQSKLRPRDANSRVARQEREAFANLIEQTASSFLACFFAPESGDFFKIIRGVFRNTKEHYAERTIRFRPLFFTPSMNFLMPSSPSQSI